MVIPIPEPVAEENPTNTPEDNKAGTVEVVQGTEPEKPVVKTPQDSEPDTEEGEEEPNNGGSFIIRSMYPSFIYIRRTFKLFDSCDASQSQNMYLFRRTFVTSLL